VEILEELEPYLPPVPIDAKQLRHAFLNIIKNSFEAMPGGGKVTVSTAWGNGIVEVSFADTGRGIVEEDRELVFTPFFSTKPQGTGLGLSITSHIIQEHRGTIGLESYPDVGTIFTIRLPARLRERSLLRAGENGEENTAVWSAEAERTGETKGGDSGNQKCSGRG